MRDIAVQDSLRGLYNRRFIEESLVNALETAHRHERDTAAIIIDLDDFKFVNDTYGHFIGDHVLSEFADLLRQETRRADIIGRYGGDEFAVILPDGNSASARQVAQRVLDATRKKTFCLYENPLTLQISAGVAEAGEETRHAQDPCDELLSKADQALYMAKWAGRNCVRVWEQREDTETSDSRLTTANQPEAGSQAMKMPKLGYRIMVIDDDADVRDLLQNFFANRNYVVTTKASAEEAIHELDDNLHTYDMILIDINMPGMNGMELLQRLQQQDDSVLKIILTAHATMDHALQSLRHGAYDFIEKPVSMEELANVVERGMSYRKLLMENQHYHAHLQDMVRKQSAELSRSFEQLEKSYEFTLEALVRMLEAREHNYGQHSLRIRELALTFGKEMGLNEDELRVLAHGALLHDIGKIGIPDRVLLKPRALNAQEWEIMKKHPEIGYNVLRPSPWLTNAAEIVYSHQERFDGTGYPRGLKGQEIEFGARIFAITDAYDAMRTDRVYSGALAVDKAVEEIRRNRGTQFDPEAVDTFCKCHAALENIIQQSQ